MEACKWAHWKGGISSQIKKATSCFVSEFFFGFSRYQSKTGFILWNWLPPTPTYKRVYVLDWVNLDFLTVGNDITYLKIWEFFLMKPVFVTILTIYSKCIIKMIFKTFIDVVISSRQITLCLLRAVDAKTNEFYLGFKIFEVLITYKLWAN